MHYHIACDLTSSVTTFDLLDKALNVIILLIVVFNDSRKTLYCLSASAQTALLITSARIKHVAEARIADRLESSSLAGSNHRAPIHHR